VITTSHLHPPLTRASFTNSRY